MNLAFQKTTDFREKFKDKKFEKPKVSIIVPIYNVEPYIGECLDSLIQQTLIELEFICIDDGSTDNSYKILEEYAKYDARFIVLKQNREGQGIGRNKCIELAKGEYIAFVDPDDKLELNAMEELYNFAKEKNAEVVQFDYITFGVSTKDKRNSFIKKYRKEFNFDLQKNNVFNWRDLKNEKLLIDIDHHVWCRFYKTSFVKDNNLKFAPTTNGEDHLFVIGMLFSASKIHFLNKSFYWYRLRPGSMVNTKSDNSFCAFTNLELTEKYLQEKGLLPELDLILSRYKTQKLQWHITQIIEDSIPRYLEQAKNFLSTEEYEHFDKLLKTPRYSLTEQIFSLKNESINGVKYKYLTIFGFKLQITPKAEGSIQDNKNNI